MRVNQRTVAIVLNEDGRNVMRLVAPEIPDSPIEWFYVQDTDETGLWVRIAREDGDHFVLIRWEFVLSLDVVAGETKIVGLKA